MLLTGEIVAWLYQNILLKKAKKNQTKQKQFIVGYTKLISRAWTIPNIHFSVEISNTVTVLYPLNVKQMSPFNNKKYI